MIDGISIRSPDLPGVEMAWFSALCADDYEFLGVPDGRLRSSWEHCRDIVLTAERLGFNNILLPSGFVPGQDTLTFAGGMAALTRRFPYWSRFVAANTIPPCWRGPLPASTICFADG
jgi:alkanesulfonate monooxygenase